MSEIIVNFQPGQPTTVRPTNAFRLEVRQVEGLADDCSRQTMRTGPPGLPGAPGADGADGLSLIELLGVPTTMPLGVLGRFGTDIYFSTGTQIRLIASQLVSDITPSNDPVTWDNFLFDSQTFGE